MCWSATVSLNTFIFSFFGTVFALANGVVSIESYLYILSFISMQLLEYFTWKNIDNASMIRLLSHVGTLIILSQVPLAINRDSTLRNKSLWYLAFACVTLAMFATTKVKYSMHRAPNGHLAWDWLSSWPKWYMAFWALCCIAVLVHMKRYGTCAFFMCTLVLSYYTYSSSGTWGSMWCWVSNFLALWWIAQVFYKDVCIS